MDMKPISIFTALDLELNQPSRKIIQIGAVIGDIGTGKILNKISIFVNPNERLNHKITELTKITQKDVDNGLSLEDAYYKLKKIHENYGSFINCITWGGADTQELLKQLRNENPKFAEEECEDWCFGRRWIDAKTLYVSYRIANGSQVQGGLAKAMTKFGLKFMGQKHNAADDAENTFHIYSRMLCLLKDHTK